MENQFNEILDNLDEEEQVEETKVNQEKSKKVIEVQEEDKEQTRAAIRFRLFMVLLFAAIIMLGILIAQIVLLALR